MSLNINYKLNTLKILRNLSRNEVYNFSNAMSLINPTNFKMTVFDNRNIAKKIGNVKIREIKSVTI